MFSTNVLRASHTKSSGALLCKGYSAMNRRSEKALLNHCKAAASLERARLLDACAQLLVGKVLHLRSRPKLQG